MRQLPFGKPADVEAAMKRLQAEVAAEEARVAAMTPEERAAYEVARQQRTFDAFGYVPGVEPPGVELDEDEEPIFGPSEGFI